ncbi:zinc-binding alcohol dehydrogenase domain-containing protein cipB [Apiospora saccharicola]|uniref:Zinc-binding alcohol dehydrogenase domain-containing protein cipB n=1 Tax=Apiospora saccharicola TaxID=335842 RepID=A0ABR1TL36_9PEZI
MVNQHKAAFLDGKDQKLRTASRDSGAPGPGELLIKVKAVAINPVDWKIQDYGVFISEWPTVLGEDLAGEVMEVGRGDAEQTYQAGDRVIAHSQFLGNKKLDQAGFQEIVTAPVSSVAKLPDNISFEEGVVLPLALSTAAAGLFQPDHLGLDKPSLKPTKNGKTVLVWGGSSSVGTAAIQLAVAAGYEVVSTASPHNFDLVKSLGARAVLDHSDKDLHQKLVAELKKGEFAGVYDSIGLADCEKQAAQVVSELGGGKMTSVLPPPEGLPENVKSGGVFAITIFTQYPDVGKVIWQDFVPAALKSGQLKPAPAPEVVGRGVDSLQAAFDKQKAGVSAKKIVVPF